MGARGAEGVFDYRFRLRVCAPFDWHAWLSFMDAHGTPGVEGVFAAEGQALSSGAYWRGFSQSGVDGTLRLSLNPARSSVSSPSGAGLASALFRVTKPLDEMGRMRLRARIRHLLDLDEDRQMVLNHLREDTRLRTIVDRRPGLVVPGCFSAFELLVRTILGQQVSLKGANTISGRLARAFGKRLPLGLRQADTPDALNRLFPTARRLAALAETKIGEIGIPRARANTIKNVAMETVKHNWFDETHSAGSHGHSVLDEGLERLPGIGPWTRAYVALRGFHDTDAFPSSDLALRKALSVVPMDERELLALADRWRPYRGYAAMHLWSHYSQGKQNSSSSRGSNGPRRRK